MAAGATVDENERLWVQVVPLELIEEENLKLTVFLYHYCLHAIIKIMLFFFQVIDNLLLFKHRKMFFLQY